MRTYTTLSLILALASALLFGGCVASTHLGDDDDDTEGIIHGDDDAEGDDDTQGDDDTGDPNDQDGDGWTPDEGDCNDQDPDVHPGAIEVCDGIDNDCDPSNDEDTDNDGDGYSLCEGDCNDGDPNQSPTATDLVGDGVDQNCDGVDGFDGDGDGYASEESGGDDCDDNDNGIFPGAVEVWYDGVAQDCDDWDDPLWSDGDQDGDGVDAEVVGGQDCDDTDPNIRPAAPEYNDDGIDNNCNGVTDGFSLILDWTAGLTWTDCQQNPNSVVLTISGTDFGEGGYSVLALHNQDGWDDVSPTTQGTDMPEVTMECDDLDAIGPTAYDTFRLDVYPTGDTGCWAWGYNPDSLDADGDCLREDPTLY